MNITKLFEMQKGLEARIEEKHPRGDENRLRLKCVALGVEIAEAANEYRGFKFWSNDREPRRDKLREEVVDVLHFVLSIGLEIGYDRQSTEGLEALHPLKHKDTIEQFAVLSIEAWLFYDTTMKNSAYRDTWRVYLGLVEQLGFTWDEIEAAYVAKNEVNHGRQESGY